MDIGHRHGSAFIAFYSSLYTFYWDINSRTARHCECIYIYMTWLLFRLFVRRDGRSEIYKVPSPILATKKLSLKELTYLLPRTIYHFYPAHNEGSRLRPPRERTFATTFSSRLRKRLSKMPTRRRCLVANKW